MSDRYFSGSYRNTYDSYPTNNLSNWASSQYEYVKPVNDRNNIDIKQSNISQQTIIHRAKLYSPDKSQQIFKRTLNNSQAYDKTKAKKTQITAKIHQIVDLCQSQKDAQINEFKQVIDAQKRILDMLHQPNRHEQSNLNINLNNLGESIQDRGTTFGPIRNQQHNFSKNQPKSTYQRQNMGNIRQTAQRDNIYKKSAIDDLKTDRNAEESVNQNQNIHQLQFKPQSTMQNRQFSKQPRNFFFNDQTEKMIQQIQRKAMDQIESLRNDKIQLMKRLNQQIRAHNQQKKLRVRLQNQLARLKGQQLPHKQSFQNIHNVYTNPNQKSQKILHQQAFEKQNARNTQNNQMSPKRNQGFHPAEQGNQSNNNQINYNRISYPQTGHQITYQQFQNQPQYIQPVSTQYIQPNSQQYIQQPSRPSQYQRLNIDSRNSYQNQNLDMYERQIARLKNQNNSLMKRLKSGSKNSQKQELRYQISKLNQLVMQYQVYVQKFRKQKGVDQRELHELVKQSERIQQQGQKIMRKKEAEKYINPSLRQNLQRNEQSRNQIMEDANNFKKRLIQYNGNNGKSNKNIKFGSRKDIYQENRTSLPNLNVQQSYKIQEFENVINQLRSAAR